MSARARKLDDEFPLIKGCGCGKRFSAAQWSKLRFVGRMDDGDAGELELRNCRCGSTLAIKVAREGAS